jgi:transcriptional regulator with XRE-family HTH domain
MQVIASWTGAEADALRQAMRMTSESFAGHLGVSVRTVANWRGRPWMHPQQKLQEVLDAALEQAPDRAKGQFSLLVGETADSPGDQPYTGSPFSVSLEDMTSPEWTGDDARQLSLSFDSALERSAAEDVERLSHMWLICDPPQVIELNAGRRIGDALVSAVEHRVIQLRRADDFITGTASRDLMRTSPPTAQQGCTPRTYSACPGG